MSESTLTMKFRGLEGEILDELVGSGLFATKSEAVRSSLVHLAMRLDLFKRKKLWERIKEVPRRNVSVKKLFKEIEAVKNDS